MIATPGYSYLQLVYEDDNIWICFAYSEALSRVVLWKMAKDGPRSMVENAKLIHEYETLSLLPVEGVLKPHTLLRQGRSMVLLFDTINALVLRQYMASGPIDPICFLRLAEQIVSIVEELHRHELLHMNLRPDTILLVQESMQVCLTGFSDSVPFSQSLQATRLEGYPPYLAPERTAGVSQPPDERTDLYSLGVTFYEMLAGELPFRANDPLQWAHAHIAKRPPSLADKYGVPGPLEAIVSKLLAKAPEDRYQRAAELRDDVRLCLKQLEERNKMNKPSPSSNATSLEERLLNKSEAYTYTPIRQSGFTPFTDGGYSQMLDLAAVFKASQIFASESDPFERVRLLMLLLLEQGGASRGCWISLRQGRYTVELSAELTDDLSWSFEAVRVPLERFASALPEVIMEAASARTAVCLNDAAVADKLQHTDYAARTGLKAAMCCPLPTQENVSMLLYMENRQSANAFSSKRISVLKMVAMQLFYAMRMAVPEEREPSAPALPESLPAESALTARELEVLNLIAAGFSNKEIAIRLVVATETVKAHIRNIFGKLGVSRRIQAVEAGRQLGLIR